MYTRCRQLLLLMHEQGGRTSQERRTCQTKIKFKTKTGLTKEGGITIGSTTTGGATSRILIFKSKLRYNALPQLPRARSWSNLKWALGRTHAFLWPRVPQYSRDLSQQQAHNHWRDNCCHTSTSTFGHPIEQPCQQPVWGRAFPVYPAKYLFSLIIFTILSSLYISKRKMNN